MQLLVFQMCKKINLDILKFTVDGKNYDELTDKADTIISEFFEDWIALDENEQEPTLDFPWPKNLEIYDLEIHRLALDRWSADVTVGIINDGPEE